MFFSNALLAKDDPLGRLFFASFGNRGLDRKDIDSTSIVKSVEEIMKRTLEHGPVGDMSPVPLALRLTGTLMLGTVRIFCRKVMFLKADCENAMKQIDKPTHWYTTSAVESSGNGISSVQATLLHATTTQPSRKRKSSAVAKDADISFPYQDDVLLNPLDILEPISGDPGLSLTGDKNSSGKADYVQGHDAFLQLNLDHNMLGSQLDNDRDLYEGNGAGMDFEEEPELLRDASTEQGDLADAHPLPDLPRMTPVSNKSRRFSASQSLPSRDGSNSLPGAEANAGPGPLPELPSPPDMPMADLADFPQTDFRANTQHDQIDALQEGAASPSLGDVDMQDADAQPEAQLAEGRNNAQPGTPVLAAHDKQAGSGAVHDAQPSPAFEQDAAPGAASPAAPSPGALAARRNRRRAAKVANTKLFALGAGDDTRLPRAHVRALINDRSAFLSDRPSLLELEDAQRAATDRSTEFEVMLRVRAPDSGQCSSRAQRRFRAFATARPIPCSVWRDDMSEGEEADEIEEAGTPTDTFAGRAGTPGSGGQRAPAAEAPAMCAQDITGDGAPPTESIEELRDATPSMGGASPTRPIDLPMPSVHASSMNLNPERDGSIQDLVPPPDADMDMPQPDLPDFDPPDFDARGIDDSGVPYPTPASAGGRNTNEGIMGTQGTGFESQNVEDNSLNAHTRATLARLEQLAEASDNGSKRMRSAHRMVELTDLMAAQSREEAAKTFYDALVLQSKGMVQIAPQAIEFENLQLELAEVAV